MTVLKEMIIRYETDGRIVKGYDAGELIRCKDCKHRFEGEMFPNCCEVLMEMSHWLVEMPVKDDWHCGSGERKEK